MVAVGLSRGRAGSITKPVPTLCPHLGNIVVIQWH